MAGRKNFWMQSDFWPAVWRKKAPNLLNTCDRVLLIIRLYLKRLYAVAHPELSLRVGVDPEAVYNSCLVLKIVP
jgi:hypothetical protein